MLITQSISYDYHHGNMEKHRTGLTKKLQAELISSAVRVLPELIGYQSQVMDGHIQVHASVSILPGQEVDILHVRSSKLLKLLTHLRVEYDTAVACIEQLPDMSSDERQRQENLKTHYADLALLGGVDFRQEDQERNAAKQTKAKKKQPIDEDDDVEDDFEDDGLVDAFGVKQVNQFDQEWEEFVEGIDEEEDQAPTPRKKATPLPDQDTLHEEEDEA